jgi:hypothetical protein
MQVRFYNQYVTRIPESHCPRAGWKSSTIEPGAENPYCKEREEDRKLRKEKQFLKFRCR